MASSLNGTGVTFSDGSTKNSNNVNVQTFNSTGTWTKPAGYSMARIQVWGGGGGSAKGGSSATAAGGGGGAYNEVTLPISYLAATVTATVGSGGAAGVGTNGVGGVGGTSSFALATAWDGLSSVNAYGGGGGGYVNGCAGGAGGGGGSQFSAGSINNASGTTIRGNPSGNNFWIGADGWGVGATNPNFYGSVWGGGPGYGASMSGFATPNSVHGGNGGGAGVAGTQPGGGGGAQNSSAAATVGGAGRIVVTCW